MDSNLKKQLLNDFLLCSTVVNSWGNTTNYFIVNKSNIDFLTFNNYKLAINILSNKILFRSDNKDLIDRLID